MADVPIVSSTSSGSVGRVHALQLEVTSQSPQTTSQSSPGQIVPPDRERSPRVQPAPSGVQRLIQHIGVTNQQFRDERQFVDARQVQLNVGIDPAVHQATVDSLRVEAETRHHEILRADWQQAAQYHQGVLQDEKNLAESRHHAILQNELGQAQHVMSQAREDAQKFVNQELLDVRNSQSLLVQKYDNTISALRSQHEQSVIELRKQHATEIKKLRVDHEQKVEEILEGFSRISKELELAKADRAQLLEALGISSRGGPLQESCEAAPPYTGIGLGNPISSTSLVPKELFSGVVGVDPRGNAVGGLDAVPGPSEPSLQPAAAYDQVIATLQEEIQNLNIQSRPKRQVKDDESSSSSGSQSSLENHYKQESKLMRIKAYDKLKIPSIPKSAAELRTWKNTLISQLTSCCRSSERELLAWLVKPLDGEEFSSFEFPVLNRVLGAKILESAKGSRFAIDFQALQERSIRSGVQAPGILFVAKICKRFRLDKEEGMSLSQQHLISLKPQGSEIKDLEIFRDRVWQSGIHP